MRLFLTVLFCLLSVSCIAGEEIIITKQIEIITKEYLDYQFEAFVETSEIHKWLDKHKEDYINGLFPHYNKDKKEFDGYIVYFQKKNPNPIIIIINGKQLTEEETKQYLNKGNQIDKN